MPRSPNLLLLDSLTDTVHIFCFSHCEFVLSKPNTIMSRLLLLQVLLHNPTDFPNVVNQYFRVPLDRDVVVGIKPNVMNTSTELRSYPPERRQCFFATERHLLHFSIYTQENCDSECYTNYTLKQCGCVAYYMPRELKLLGRTLCIQGPKTIKHMISNSVAPYLIISSLISIKKSDLLFLYIFWYHCTYFNQIWHSSTESSWIDVRHFETSQEYFVYCKKPIVPVHWGFLHLIQLKIKHLIL